MFRTIAFNIVKYRFNDISFCSLRTVTEIGKILDFTAKCCWITCGGKRSVSEDRETMLEEYSKNKVA